MTRRSVHIDIHPVELNNILVDEEVFPPAFQFGDCQERSGERIPILKETSNLHSEKGS